MARLPVPGGDDGDWGDILNAFLDVSHNHDGSLANNTVGTNQLQSGSVTSAQLDSPTQTAIAAVASKYVKPTDGIPVSDLSSPVQAGLSVATTAVQSVNGKTGTTVTLAASDVSALPTSTKLSGLADTSAASSATNDQVLSYNGTTEQWVPATVTSTTISDATTSSKGIVELAGDLGGTAVSPTVPTKVSKAGDSMTGDLVLPGTPSEALGAAPKQYVDAETTRAEAAEALLIPLSQKGAASGVASLDSTGKVPGSQLPAASASTLASDTDVSITSPSNNQVLTYDSTSSKWQNQAPPTASNATSSAPGLIQLDGDLSGTATSPTVAKFNGISLPTSAPSSSGQVLTATSSSATAWQTPAAGVSLDTTASDIQADTTTGSPVAGSTGKAADAGHQHPLAQHDHSTANEGGQLSPTAALSATGTASSSTYLRGDNSWAAPPTASNATSSSPGLIQLDGDLGGSATSPTVEKLSGVALPSSAPTGSGQVLTATSSSATTWQTPAAGVSLDTNASDIQPLGTQGAGSTGKAADAGHVHAMPRLDQVSAPTSAVALNSQKITGLGNGTASTDAAAFGQIPVAGTTAGTYAAGNDSRFAGSALGATSLQQLPIQSIVTSAGALVPGAHNPVNATSGSLTMTLPTGQALGTLLGVEKTDSSTNAVAITGNIRDTAAQTLSLSLLHEEVLFEADSSGSWWPIAGHKTLSSLDARYVNQSALGAPSGVATLNSSSQLSAGQLPSSVVTGEQTTGAPTTGTWQAGQIVIDSTGTTWVCTGGGSPGTWTQGAGGGLTPSGQPALYEPVANGSGSAIWVKRPDYPIQYYGAKIDGRRVGDGAMNSATNPTYLTSATANFTSADVGKLVTVQGAAASGTARSSMLATTIASIVSSTVAVLNASCANTVSGQEVIIGTDDTTAWNAAITAATATGGVVTGHDGLSCVSATITIPGGVDIEGTGIDYAQVTLAPQRHLVLIAAAQINGPVLQIGTSPTTLTSGYTGASIRNLIVDGSFGAVYAVKTLGARNYIRGCQIYRGYTTSLWMAGQNGYCIDSVLGGSYSSSSVLVSGEPDNKIYGCQVRNANQLNLNTQCAQIEITASSTHVAACHMFSGNTNSDSASVIINDIWVHGATGDVRITDNIFDGTYGDQICIQTLGSSANMCNFNIVGNKFYQVNLETLQASYSCILLDTTYGGTISQVAIAGSVYYNSSSSITYRAFLAIAGTGVSQLSVMGNNGSGANRIVYLTGSATMAAFSGFRGNSNRTGLTTTVGTTAPSGTLTVSDNAGQATCSGTGSQTAFTIAHGLDTSSIGAPTVLSASAANTVTQAGGVISVTADTANVTVTFATAPASGTNNVLVNWAAAFR